MTKLLFTLFTAAAIAGPAVAGPYFPEWSYSTTFSGDRGSGYVDAGYGARQDSSSSTGFRYYQGYVQLTAAVSAGTVLNSGTNTVQLGSTPGYTGFYWANDPEHAPPTPPVDDAPLPGGKLDAMMKASITITDAASGAEHTVSLLRDLAHGGGDVYLGLPVTLISATEPLVNEFDLGGHHYKVTLHEAQGPNGPNMTGPLQLLVADVSVNAVADTPEPGTLALGGIGLAGAGLARLRRRK